VGSVVFEVHFKVRCSTFVVRHFWIQNLGYGCPSPDCSGNPFWIVWSAAEENLHEAQRNAKRLQRKAGYSSQKSKIKMNIEQRPERQRTGEAILNFEICEYRGYFRLFLRSEGTPKIHGALH